MNKGTLYICPTPIGNLEDITLRTLKVLREVDLIAAEDTRHTVKLLNHYNIKKPLISYHEHNKKSKGDLLVKKLISGLNIGLVTDAGMPGISDPGEDIIKMCINEDIQVIALPGASAFILGLILSGFSTEKFVFEGFLPSKQKDRIKELERLKDEKRTIILYEGPHRLKALLKDILNTFGNRNISISRELTKIHEETFRGTVLEAIDKFSHKPKGELVIVIEGKNTDENLNMDIDIKEQIKKYMDLGFSKKDAVRKVAKEKNIPKNKVYKESIDMD